MKKYLEKNKQVMCERYLIFENLRLVQKRLESVVSSLAIATTACSCEAVEDTNGSVSARVNDSSSFSTASTLRGSLEAALPLSQLLLRGRVSKGADDSTNDKGCEVAEEEEEEKGGGGGGGGGRSGASGIEDGGRGSKDGGRGEDCEAEEGGGEGGGGGGGRDRGGTRESCVLRNDVEDEGGGGGGEGCSNPICCRKSFPM
ncbi:hypothetical protein RFI_12462 [Reticulomyxa filosa]|uniref:Uncharacterized protein n=1 Tax=Reticulomyxa filosa TaxID=46433 RepID=X6NFC6_RETFI|nr:hypothetical protein RFI_12462 [Reticulomyxa filosa]|eukprot:ETO24691.1 hypothetical protein RFI_12462 [Reticulomyxa filosa]